MARESREAGITARHCFIFFFATRMRARTAPMAAALVALAICACSSVNKERTALSEIKWPIGASAIRIDVNADQNLNLYEGKRHTLLLAVCQTADPNAFLSQLSNQASIASLLVSGQTLAAGFLSANRFVVSPGQHELLTMDRAKGAQYVGVVAGYYRLDPNGAARLFVVPVSLRTSGFFFKTVTAGIDPLQVDLDLGPTQIRSASRSVAGIAGQLVPVPGEHDGLIPITAAGIAASQNASPPTIVAFP